MEDKNINSLVPKIRFKGFTSAWEQQRLGDVCQITTGKLDANAMVPNGKYNFYTSGIAIYKINEFAFEGPAITIAGNGATVGYLHFADGKFNAYQRTYVLTDFVYDRKFIFYTIGNVLPLKINQEARAGNIPYIVMDMLTELEFLSPSLKEQIKIGDFLDNLDTLLTLRQRELDKLKEIKKGLLQKMFPSDGEDKPRIRFKGFTSAWEQQRLGDVCIFIKDGTHASYKDSIKGPFLLSAKNIKNGQVIIDEQSDRKISQSDYDEIFSKYSLMENDVLLTIVGSIGEVAILKNPYNIAFQRSVAVLRTSPKINPLFLSYILQGFRFQRDLDDRKSMSAQPGIYLGELNNILIEFPPTEEQIKIGVILKSLDTLLTLRQRELDKLKEIKKGLLQKMFI